MIEFIVFLLLKNEYFRIFRENPWRKYNYFHCAKVFVNFFSEYYNQ